MLSIPVFSFEYKIYIMETTLLKDALTVILERKSVRHYTADPVSNEDIEKILQAAMAAPAAVHMLPWKFVVIKERYLLEKLSKGLPFAQMLKQAPVAIVVCAVPEEAAMHSEVYAVLDCACASENILLAAEALGLGGVWTAVYPNKEIIDFVKETLEIPDRVIPLNIIPIGHPAGDEVTKDKYDKKNIHWEKW